MLKDLKTLFLTRNHFNLKPELYILPLILIISFIIYRSLLFADFLAYDDIGNIVRNKSVTGFSIKDIFTTSVYYSYNPITFLSYALEYRLWGMNAGWFHLTNILLHLVNIILVYRLIFILVKEKSISLISAALFAFHPMHSDVIGWLSARSYLLATLFFLLSLIIYIQYLQAIPRKNHKLILSLLFFIFACLSKSQAVTLAPVILLVNWLYKSRYDLRQIITVTAFFCIAVATGLLTIYFRTDLGKTEIIPDYSVMEKVCVISFSVLKYFYKSIYPIGLTAIESFPNRLTSGVFPLMVYVSPFVILIICIMLWVYRRKASIVVFGLLFFLLNILVTQFSFLEDGFCANRYYYLSSIGLFLAFTVFVYSLIRKFSISKAWGFGGFMILLLVSGSISSSRSKSWTNIFSLSSSIIENSPDVTMAYNLRGVWYYEQGVYERSILDFNKAISIFPAYSSAYYNRGLSLAAMQDFQSALEDYDRAIRLNPNYTSAYIARGVLKLEAVYDFPAALNDFNKATSLDPYNAQAYYNQGLTYFRMRNVEEACKSWFKVKSLGYTQADHMISRYCR